MIMNACLQLIVVTTLPVRVANKIASPDVAKLFFITPTRCIVGLFMTGTMYYVSRTEYWAIQNLQIDL